MGLTLFQLLPSRQNTRALICTACGGKFDLSNGSKMAAVMSGMIGMALCARYPFGWIVKAGNGTKLSVLTGIAVIALGIVGAAMAGAWLTLSLDAK